MSSLQIQVFNQWSNGVMFTNACIDIYVGWKNCYSELSMYIFKPLPFLKMQLSFSALVIIIEDRIRSKYFCFKFVTLQFHMILTFDGGDLSKCRNIWSWDKQNYYKTFEECAYWYHTMTLQCLTLKSWNFSFWQFLGVPLDCTKTCCLNLFNDHLMFQQFHFFCTKNLIVKCMSNSSH